MSSSCAAAPLVEFPVPGSPLHQALIVLAVLYPVFALSCFAVFYTNRNANLYLRKRPIGIILGAMFGLVGSWFTLVLYDLIADPVYFPCWLFKLLSYINFMIIIAPTQLKLFRYVTETSVERLKVHLGTLQAERAKSGSGGDDTAAEQQQLNISPEGSRRTWLAYYKITLSRSGRRAKGGGATIEERILAAKFTRSYWFLLYWVSITSIPYLVAFLIRLAADPSWTACPGLACDFDYIDAVVLLCITSFSSVLGISLCVLLMKKQGDPLGIVQECVTTWVAGSTTCALTLVLIWADPGSLQRRNVLHWRYLFLGSVLSMIYTHTVHQVWLSRRFTRRLVVTTAIGVDRGEQLADVLSDRELHEELKQYLNRELSGEILLFLDAVESFRTSSPLRPAVAKSIVDMFIAKNAPFEVNLPSAVRERVLLTAASVTSTTTTTVDRCMFDEAYADVRDHFLNDGFARFLRHLAKRNHRTPRSPAAAALATRIIAREEV